MAFPSRRDRLGLEGLHGYMWGVIALVALSFFYAVLQVGFVRPLLWPAGTGATIAGDPAAAFPLIARTPNVHADLGQAAVIARVASGTPAAGARLAPGDIVLAQEGPQRGRVADFSSLTTATPGARRGARRTGSASAGL